MESTQSLAPPSTLSNAPFVRCAYDCLLNPAHHKNFKRDPRYTEVLEHVPPMLGIKYLRMSQIFFPEAFKAIDWEMVRKNDSIGNPTTHNFENFLACHNANFSPTSFRYIFTALTVLDYLKRKGLHFPTITEIGGGYGGQLYFLVSLAPYFEINIRHYLLIDLEIIALHQKKYLEEIGVSNFECCAFEDVREGRRDTGDHDLLISNYALSELTQEDQDMYIDKVVKRCANSFLTWNRKKIHPYFLSDAFVAADEPSGADNKIIFSQ